MNKTNTQKVNKSVAKYTNISWLKKMINPIQEVFLNRTNVYLLAVAVIYRTFRPFFEEFFSKYWVTPFLVYFQNEIPTQIVAWFVIIGIVVVCGIECKNRKRISEIRLYRWILITAIWASVRFSEAWIFIPLFGNITYFDIVPLYTLSVVATYVCQFIKRKPSEKIEEDGFECDEPIETNEEDLLGRRGFAQTLARRIIKTKPKNQSFAVGILSPWGYGKTSFLNLIKDELKRHETICIDFSPWIYGKENNLIREFFTEVGKHLRKFADTLPRDMMEYAQILEKNESTSWLSMLLSLGNMGHNIEQQGNLLKMSLLKIDRPIVVFIDDLDRLGSNEIMEVLKLIRNAANFSEIKFVVAYDRTYLVEAIKQQNTGSANRYLEKIFQIEYTLPAFDRENLEIYLKKECDKFVHEEEKESLNRIFNSKESFESIAIEELLTLRDAKRYINSLKNIYIKLAGNVVLRDLMNIEILQLKYKPVYELLSQQWEQVLIEENVILKLYEKSNKEQEKDIFLYIKLPSYNINTRLKEIGYNKVEIERIRRILYFLFPSFRTSAEYGAINHKATIARYFYDTIQERDLPIETFNRLWLKNYEYIKEDVNNIISCHQTYSFVSQLDSFIPDSAVVCKNVIRIMFYVGSSNSQINSLYNTILNRINLLEDYQIEDMEIKTFLLDIIEENGLSNYISGFLSSEFRSLEKYFSFEEIREIETNYLQKAIQQDLSLNIIYDYMSRATNNEYDYNENEKAYALFKLYTNRHIEEFMKSMVISMNAPKGYYYVSQLAQEVWGTWGNFQNYIKSIFPRTPIIDEFEKFLNKFINKGAQNATTYNFKHIAVNK
ncbi:MAG: hypothetical protein BHV77_06470 [Bacteroides sp. 43_108]|nr:MAG: hypothetical protein BHV77_06470 [Bacteroides sp. 43_108]